MLKTFHTSLNPDAVYLYIYSYIVPWKMFSRKKMLTEKVDYKTCNGDIAENRTFASLFFKS